MLMKLKLHAIRALQILLFFVPVKKNRIMFYANSRKGYVCNPAALMNALEKRVPGGYERIWVTRYPESCEARAGVTVVRQRSMAYFIAFLRTRYFITNDMVDEALVKKRGQIFLTTWHGGGAYKKVGLSTQNEDAGFAKNFSKWYGRLDYFVSSCQACTDLYADAFGLDRHSFLETGTPRNDIFFEDHPEIPEKVRNFYGLSETTRILLFAPSFQMSDREKEQYDIRTLLTTVQMLKNEAGEDWVILYRCHYFHEASETPFGDTIKDGNAYCEMQDLLYAADVLVTDFSSCMWDFALQGRPIFVLENRLREYEREDRGFFVPYEAWPYQRCSSLDDLPSQMLAHRNEDFTSAYAAHFREMGSFERGHACRLILDRLLASPERKRSLEK